MTKESFIEQSVNIASMYDNNVPTGRELSMKNMKRLCDEFFNDKVIIQRGENRHPYADVFHEWVEDTSKELQYDASPDGRGGMWEQSSLMRANHRIKIRIKPKEPIYEWQWYVVADDTHEPMMIGWATEEERKADTFWDYKGTHKMEFTKRERKTN